MVCKSLSDNVMAIWVMTRVIVSVRVRVSVKLVYREGQEAIRINKTSILRCVTPEDMGSRRLYNDSLLG